MKLYNLGDKSFETNFRSLDLTNGVRSYVFGIVTKQQLLPGYAHEIPSVTSARNFPALSLKLMPKMTKSSGK